MSRLKRRERSTPSLHFCSTRALDGLDDTHLDRGGRSSLLHLLIQMLTFFRGAFRDTPRHNILPVTWASLSPGKLSHKINHHIAVPQPFLILQPPKRWGWGKCPPNQ